MATTVESIGRLDSECVDFKNPWSQDVTVSDPTKLKTHHEKAFTGFSPDADFDDVLRTNAQFASRYLACKKGILTLGEDDREMLELNGQAMAAHNGQWARAASFAEIESIDPRANYANIGGTVLTLVDPNNLEIDR